MDGEATILCDWVAIMFLDWSGRKTLTGRHRSTSWVHLTLDPHTLTHHSISQGCEIPTRNYILQEKLLRKKPCLCFVLDPFFRLFFVASCSTQSSSVFAHDLVAYCQLIDIFNAVFRWFFTHHHNVHCSGLFVCLLVGLNGEGLHVYAYSLLILLTCICFYKLQSEISLTFSYSSKLAFVWSIYWRDGNIFLIF